MVTTISKPDVTLQVIGAQDISGVADQKILLIGQQTAAAVASGTLVENVLSQDTDTLFGVRSHVAGMVRSVKRVLQGINPGPQVDVIPLDDAGGAVAATSVLTITGTNATEDGAIVLTVGSAQDHVFSVDVLSGDTPDDVVAAINALIGLDLTAPFTSGAVTNVLTVTASNLGTIANDWGIAVDGQVAGLTLVLTGWTGGTGTPVITTVFDPVADIRYQTVVWPESYTEVSVADFLDARFNVSNDVLDGVAIIHKSDTLSNLKAIALPLNSQSVNIMGNKPVSTSIYIAPAVFGIGDNMAAEIAAIRGARLTNNAPISAFVLASGSPADAFGGIGISSKPYHNTSLPFIAIPRVGLYFSREDQDELNNNGVSTFGANRSLTETILSTQVTTYLTDGAGNPDTSFKFLNTVDQGSAVREFYFQNLKARYAQHRLTNGPLVPRRAMTNAASIRVFCSELYIALANEAITQSGQAALQDYRETLSVIIDLAAGKVTIDQKPLLVSQLRVILGTIEINFGS
ncbi:MAG: hypothetical protein V3U60_16285 [Gammaproteobacteria bacterium]